MIIIIIIIIIIKILIIIIIVIIIIIIIQFLFVLKFTRTKTFNFRLISLIIEENINNSIIHYSNGRIFVILQTNDQKEMKPCKFNFRKKSRYPRLAA